MIKLKFTGGIEMPVNMNTYNVAYKSRVYKAVAIVNMIFPEQSSQIGIRSAGSGTTWRLNS